MATITLLIHLKRGNEEYTHKAGFELEPGITDCVRDTIEDVIDDIADGDGRWEFVDFEDCSVDGFEEQWSLSDFDGLEDFADFAGRVDKYGEFYESRCYDVGDTDASMEDYEGCWDSAEEFVEEMYTSCGDIPDHLKFYIDWEKLARDVMMDHSAYADAAGIHIFRD